MKILVSACLLGENCKYNGKNNYSEKLKDFIKGHDVTAVCPEVMGGLSVPREPAEIKDGHVMTCSGKCIDEQFRIGAEAALAVALNEGTELAVLQSRSPSCGVREVYDGTFTGRLAAGRGVFAQLLADNGINVTDIEEI